MATLSQVQGEGAVWAGLGSTGTIPERILKRGMDNAGQLSFITRGSTRFLWMIHSRFGGKKMVGTREHRVFELSEHDRTVPVTVASTSTNNHTTFGVPNRFAAYFQPNDIFFNTNLYVSIDTTPLFAGQVTSANALPTSPGPFERLDYTTGTQPTAVNFSRTPGQDPANLNRFYKDSEQLLVRAVGDPDSAGVGNTLITVQRCARGPHAYDMGGGQVPQSLINTGVNANSNQGAFVIGDTLLQSAPAWPEGSGQPRGYHKNVEIDNNFTQEFKYALDFTLEQKIEKTWLNKSQEEIQRMLMARQKALHMERMFLFSQKGKTKDNRGQLQYTMGGALEAVHNDAAHILRFGSPTFTYPGIVDMGQQIFSLGGSETRHLFMGIELHNQFKKAFYNSGYMRFDPEASRQFDVPVDALETAGGILYLHPCWSFTEAGRGMHALSVDMSKPTFTPVTHEGWDMQVNRDERPNGQQVIKEEWIGIKGLERRYTDYLQYFIFE
jgi:hypothetical protein